MSLLIKELKRLYPLQSVSLVYDTETKKKFWRHRYTVGKTNKHMQEVEDFPYKKFRSINTFKSFIEDEPLKDTQILN